MTTNHHLFQDLRQADDETFKTILLREQQGVRFTYVPRELLNMPQQSELGVIRNSELLAVKRDTVMDTAHIAAVTGATTEQVETFCREPRCPIPPRASSSSSLMSSRL